MWQTQTFEIVIAAFAGLSIGSFLNICIFRMPLDLSVVRPRCFCPRCEKVIAWYDNIPVLSYLALRGRCRLCGERIGIRYLAVELLTAAAFAASVAHFGFSLVALKYSLFSAILIELIVSDLETQILPDEFTVGGAVLGLVLAAFVPMAPLLTLIFWTSASDPRWMSLAEGAFGAGLLSGMTWLMRWGGEKVLHREAMGLGDVKMMAMLGAFLGLQSALLAMVLGSILGTVSACTYATVTRKRLKGLEIPFGTFLGLGALVVVVTACLFPGGYSQFGY